MSIKIARVFIFQAKIDSWVLKKTKLFILSTDKTIYFYTQRGVFICWVYSNTFFNTETLYFMKRKILGLLLLVSCFMVVKSQDFHITAFTGVSNYQGDLQPKFFAFQQANFAIGIGGLYEVNEQLYLRGNVSFGKIKGDDKRYSLNTSRNLSFSSPIVDIHLGAEYDILNSYERTFVPFVFTGISIFNFNPSTQDSGGLGQVFLRPLGTEGQGFNGKNKYKLTQLALPFGGGVKYSVSDNVKIRLEMGFRKTFTDYLDDVSSTYANPAALLANNGSLAFSISYRTDEMPGGSKSYPGPNRIRGNPKLKDWYYFAGIGVSFRISTDSYY